MKQLFIHARDDDIIKLQHLCNENANYYIAAMWYIRTYKKICLVSAHGVKPAVINHRVLAMTNILFQQKFYVFVYLDDRECDKKKPSMLDGIRDLNRGYTYRHTHAYTPVYQCTHKQMHVYTAFTLIHQFVFKDACELSHLYLSRSWFINCC